MSVKVDLLSQHLQKHLGDHIVAQSIALGEITVDVDVAVYMDFPENIGNNKEEKIG